LPGRSPEQFYQDNKEQILDHKRQYYRDNKEVIDELYQRQQYKQENKEQINRKAKQKKYLSMRRLVFIF
jgi:hypothetical protein